MDAITSNSKMTFNGNIKTIGIDLDAKKMSEVQKNYRRITQHYKDDLILRRNIVYKEFDGGEVSHHNVTYTTENGTDIGATINVRKFKQWFYKTSPEDIATTLGRIFKYGKHMETIQPQEEAINKNLNNARRSSIINSYRAESSGDARYSIIAESNKNRAYALEAQQKALEKKNQYVTHQILDTADTSIMNYID